MEFASADEPTWFAVRSQFAFGAIEERFDNQREQRLAHGSAQAKTLGFGHAGRVVRCAEVHAE